MQRENRNKNVGQAMPESKGNSFWKNEIRLIIRQAEPDLRVTTTNAFTLIELLVVVLIIGILAAVAVPQYKVAVEKARAVEAITVLKSVKEAEDRYYLANGSYTTKFDELDVNIPGAVTTTSVITLASGWKISAEVTEYIYAVNKLHTNIFLFFYAHSSNPDYRMCYAKENDTLANQVCKSLGGSFRHDGLACANGVGTCTSYKL